MTTKKVTKQLILAIFDDRKLSTGTFVCGHRVDVVVVDGSDEGNTGKT